MVSYKEIPQSGLWKSQKKIANKLATIHLDEKKNVKIIIADFKCLKK